MIEVLRPDYTGEVLMARAEIDPEEGTASSMFIFGPHTADDYRALAVWAGAVAEELEG